ncbi:TonB-dependent siderophore receptor [Methylosinus sp. KRF6]|nr:TonB-dependent siderophore receptor [Methylosinus sp. KRF6]
MDAGRLLSAAALLLFSADAAAQAEPGVTSLPAVAVDAPKEKPRPIVRQNAAAARVARPRTRAAASAAQRHAPSPAAAAAPSTAPALFAAPARAELGNLPKEYAGGQAARGARLGMLGNRDFLDTPFNVTSYTSKLIENQQARTLSDVLENDPSVRFTVSSGQVRENFRIRGFSVLVSETALNGLYGVAPDGRVPTEFLERVEVLKGPAALLSGMAPYGAVGGSINLVTKQAGDTPVTSVTADYTSNSQFGTHIDVGRRFGQDNAFGIRFNGAYRGGDTTLDYQSRERGLEALALDYRGEKLRIALDAYFNQEIARGGVPIMASFTGTGVAAAPDSSNNIFRGLSGRMNNSGAMGRVEYDLADNVTLFASAGAIDARFNGLTNSTVATNVNVLGRYSGTAINLRGYTDTISFQGGLRADFRTFDIGHRLSLSAANLESKTGSTFQRSSAFVSSIYFPVTPLMARDPGEAPKSTDTTLSSIALADTLSAFDDRAQLILGLRAQRVQTKSYNTTTGAETNYYDDSAVTPAFGLIIKPLPIPMSLYANYIEGLTQGDRVTDTAAANYNQVFPPYKSRQIETGVKWDAGTIANTLSFYEIEKPSLIKSGNVYNSDGRQRNQGIEWNVFGEIVEGVRILGGASYTIGVLTKTANGQLDGKTAYGTPKWQVNLGGEWDTPFVPGLTLEGRVVYTSAQFVNSANTQKIPEWARLDAGLRYSTQLLDKKVTFRANANNLLDHNYWAGSYFADGIVTLSSPRTVLLSATVDF